jgi:hypothetical protein
VGGGAEGAGGVGDVGTRKAAVLRLNIFQYFQDGFGTVPVPGGELQHFGLEGLYTIFLLVMGPLAGVAQN